MGNMHDLNIAVVAGTIAGDAVVRDLPSGSSVAQFDLSAVVDGERLTVPVSWVDPGRRDLSRLAPDRRVAVIGSVRRRFFRVAGRTQSRTEVVAARVVPETSSKTLSAAFADAAAAIRPTDE